MGSSTEELSGPIDFPACGKAPGRDDIPPEVIKDGKRALRKHFLISVSVLGRGLGAPIHA